MKIGSLKSLCSFWANLAQNQRYSSLFEERDLLTFYERTAKEGITYLTSALPLLAKAIDRFHSTLEWIPPSGFETREVELNNMVGANSLKTIVNVPIFMGKAFEKALCCDSLAVDYIRQLSYVFYKLEVEHDQDTVDRFLESFRKVDSELPTIDSLSSDSNKVALVSGMRRIIGRILCNTDPTNIRPCHGSGATACQTKNWDKYHKLRYYPKLDDVFPYPEYFFYSPTHLVDELEKLEKSTVSISRARVCLVPKDARGPRVISCEPAELMYIQQGIMSLLYEVLENHPLTTGQINFVDQGVNRALAREGSLTGELATIDLAEASDRVSLSLIELVFPPRWVEALKACRSEETLLPDGTLVKLNKFAPMGSSCCFPVEALVFWACAQASLQIQNPYEFKRVGANVFVYGDDIIFDSDYFEQITMGLSLIGLVVNKDKSYFKGPFRESCGGDYHLGYDVTPIRVRKAFESSSTSLLTNAELLNSIVDKFGYDSSFLLISLIEEVLDYRFPRTELQLPATIRAPKRACNDVFFKKRYNQALQREEYRILTLTNSLKKRQPRNWGELLRKELTRKDREGSLQPFENPLRIVDGFAEPGEYADVHSVRTQWTWAWLG